MDPIKSIKESKMKVIILESFKILVSLIILVGIAIMPNNVLASSGQPKFTEQDVRQVYESMKSINDALAASLAKTTQDPFDAFGKLISDGFLATLPPVPTGIGNANGDTGAGGFGTWGVRSSIVGGCGPKNIGAKRSFYIELISVSDDFCKGYNKAQGLGSIIPLNCFTKPDDACKASGSTEGEEPVDVAKNTFCFKMSDLTNKVLFNTGIDPKIPCTE
jgi:hypothetical protein